MVRIKSLTVAGDVENALLAAFLLLCLSVTACSPQSSQEENELQSIHAKNKQLAEAETKLMSNPQDKAALSEIVGILRYDPGIVARANAASTFGTVAASGAVPDLTLLLKHRNPYLRARLAVALIRIDPANSDAIRVLEQLLKDQDVQVRRVTIWELDNCGEEAAPAKAIIRRAVTDSDESVRVAATKLLAVLENP